MSPLTEARAHLVKAREFLEAAKVNADLDLCNAAVSNAVTSGINSKDAICLRLTGRTIKTESHSDAVGELRGTGSASKQLATTTRGLATSLGRLLALKTRSQYESRSLAPTAVRDALGWAEVLLEGAEVIVNQG